MCATATCILLFRHQQRQRQQPQRTASSCTSSTHPPATTFTRSCKHSISLLKKPHAHTHTYTKTCQTHVCIFCTWDGNARHENATRAAFSCDASAPRVYRKDVHDALRTMQTNKTATTTTTTSTERQQKSAPEHEKMHTETALMHQKCDIVCENVCFRP